MLGQFLKSLRKGKRLRFIDVNDAVGYKGKNLGYTERNDNAYQVNKLVKHAEVLGFDVEIHFVDREDRRNTHVFKLEESKK